MGPVAFWFMIATLATAAICFAGRRRAPHAFLMSLVLAEGWIVGRVLHEGLGPGFRAAYPVLDLLTAAVCLFLISRDAPSAKAWPSFLNRSGWKIVVLLALAAQLALHAAFPTSLPFETRRPYLMAINVLYAVQLAAVALAGSRHHFRRARFDWRRPRPSSP